MLNKKETGKTILRKITSLLLAASLLPAASVQIYAEDAAAASAADRSAAAEMSLYDESGADAVTAEGDASDTRDINDISEDGVAYEDDAPVSDDQLMPGDPADPADTPDPGEEDQESEAELTGSDGLAADASASISEISNISVTVLRNKDRMITIAWKPVKGAAYYLVTKGSDEPVRVKKSAAKTSGYYTCDFEKKIKPGKTYKFTVKAYKNDELIGESFECKVKAARISFDDSSIRTLKNKKISGSKFDYDLKDLLGESRNGYSVVQGSCTDGRYAYYLMVSSYTQKGRVLKVSLSNSKKIYRSDVINICHGNGMAYDSDRNRLVVVGRESRRNQLTLIDADTLKFIKYKTVKYDREKLTEGKFGSSYGLSAISYVHKYDCYIALQRTTHDLLILDPSFNVIGFAGTKITAKYPGTYQAMDADEKYVYLLISYYNRKQPYNRIIALDWNSENLLDHINGDDQEFARIWKCGNEEDGNPDAVMRIKTSYEAESLLHTTDSNGKSHFYLAEYFNNPKYHWVTRQKAYKVKWKKVTVKVKWKKVDGKWKYKTKKVWKYKTKYKNEKVYEVNYYRRDNYVYDLGVI